MKRYASGVGSSASSMPISCAGDGHRPATSGISTRCSSPSMGNSTIFGAVDQHGNVLDILVQSRRNKAAAKKFFRKLLKGCQYVPRVLITDKLGSYAAAKKDVLPSV